MSLPWLLHAGDVHRERFDAGFGSLWQNGLGFTDCMDTGQEPRGMRMERRARDHLQTASAASGKSCCQGCPSGGLGFLGGDGMVEASFLLF